MSSTLGSIKQPHPRRMRKRAHSLRKSLLTFASAASPVTSVHAPTNASGTDLSITGGDGASLNSEEGDDDDDDEDDEDDEDGLSPPPLMMRDASASIRIPRVVSSFRRGSSRNVDQADTVWWGWVLLVTTWVVFVVGMGSVVGMWDWAWYGSGGVQVFNGDGGDEEYDPDDELPIPGYYPALLILTWVVAWVWVVVAWVGMKYFRHARVAPAN
ncbi:hypothetical protein DRE_02280 [Drechslerella stenobrocha 248]|uniref:Uncharacterized protein n=1 Tax=Drechslerella stenobrocha 248 TaxID=1043628 RepID=W7HVH0_9PEZI|nr:hypothetical protein DRE_02280 [Drechslerella stenobrocha 248]